MKWFRLYSDILQNKKVMQLPEAMRWRYVALKALANIQTPRGTLPSNEDISFELRLSPLEVEETLKLFQSKHFSFLELKYGKLRIRNWKKRQFISDDITARTRRHKGTEKERSSEHDRNEKGTSPDNRVQNTDKKKKRKKKRKDLSLESIDPVKFKEKFPGIDVETELEKFKDHLKSKGIRRKDYHAAFRNWLRSPYTPRIEVKPEDPKQVLYRCPVHEDSFTWDVPGKKTLRCRFKDVHMNICNEIAVEESSDSTIP